MRQRNFGVAFGVLRSIVGARGLEPPNLTDVNLNWLFCLAHLTAGDFEVAVRYGVAGNREVFKDLLFSLFKLLRYGF
jgi:hypothetical protein